MTKPRITPASSDRDPSSNMYPTHRLARKKKLLLAFDAFGTLFTPKRPIFAQYGEIARRHGVTCPSDSELGKSFKAAFKEESKLHPNYGKALGMGAATWWTNVCPTLPRIV
jgi:hypothetical protein